MNKICVCVCVLFYFFWLTRLICIMQSLSFKVRLHLSVFAKFFMGRCNNYNPQSGPVARSVQFMIPKPGCVLASPREGTPWTCSSVWAMKRKNSQRMTFSEVLLALTVCSFVLLRKAFGQTLIICEYPILRWFTFQRIFIFIIFFNIRNSLRIRSFSTLPLTKENQ